ncbi:helix-turn-helix-domain containing protein type [Seiridium cupressi]
MSTINLPDLIISTFTKGLKTLAHVLATAELFAKEKGIDVNSFVQERLIEDQLPLAFQVQSISRIVQTNLGRLSGDTPTKFEDNEKTFEDLKNRVQRTQELFKTFDITKAQGKEGNEFELTFNSVNHKITLQNFMFNQALPNFFFHNSIAYAILRAKGVPLGKKDWLGGFLELEL